eukprot:g7591.t1
MQLAPAPRELEALEDELGKMAWGSNSSVRISRSALALLERMSREPSVYSSLGKVKEQVGAGGLVIVDQKGQTPVHPLLQTCELNAVISATKARVAGSRVQLPGCPEVRYFVLRGPRGAERTAAAPSGRREATGGPGAGRGSPVVVIEYPPYRPNSEAIPNSPMASLLEVYALRLQLENTRLAYTLDHALDAVLLARRRQGNVDRIYEEAWLHSQPKWELGVSATAGPPIQNTRTDGRAHGGRLDPGFTALEQGRLAILQEVRAPPISQYAAAQGNGRRRGLRSTASLAGLNVARDKSSVVYSRQAVRPEQEVSHALRHTMVLRVFSIPSVLSNNESSGAAYPRTPGSRRSGNTSSIQTAMVLPKRMQTLEAVQAQQGDSTGTGVGSGGADLGLAEQEEDEEAVLASYWWDLSLQPVVNPDSFTGLLELIRLRSTLSSHLDEEVRLVQRMSQYPTTTGADSSKRCRLRPSPSPRIT